MYDIKYSQFIKSWFLAEFNKQNAGKKDNVELIKTNTKYDEFVSTLKGGSEEKVSFKEGVKLVGKGFANKVKIWQRQLLNILLKVCLP